MQAMKATINAGRAARSRVKPLSSALKTRPNNEVLAGVSCVIFLPLVQNLLRDAGVGRSKGHMFPEDRSLAAVLPA
jgi:hypothetical protein